MPSGKMDLRTGSLVRDVCCGSVLISLGAIFVGRLRTCRGGEKGGCRACKLFMLSPTTPITRSKGHWVIMSPKWGNF